MKLTQEQKKKLKISLRCLYLVLILLPLLFTATYTWFSLSRTPRVSEMGLSVDAGTGMELAFTPDSEEWTQHLDFREQEIEMSPLKPITWSEQDQCFYAAQFGADGRIAGIAERLYDNTNSNNMTGNSYYMKLVCYARTEEPVAVSLSPAVVSGDGLQGAGTYVIGTPVWNSEEIVHENGGHGAEYAIRVGIRITKTNTEENTQIEDSVFYIYEPNCDEHIDGINTMEDTRSIDGTDTLVPKDRLIKQTASAWSEADPVQKDVVIRQLGEFTTKTDLFELRPEEQAKLEIYVWLEGQDADCTNAIGSAAQIFANIQFMAETVPNSGLDEIE